MGAEKIRYTLLPDKMMFRTLTLVAIILVAVTAEEFTTTDADALVPVASYSMDRDLPEVPPTTGDVQPLKGEEELGLTQDTHWYYPNQKRPTWQEQMSSKYHYKQHMQKAHKKKKKKDHDHKKKKKLHHHFKHHHLLNHHHFNHHHWHMEKFHKHFHKHIKNYKPRRL